MDTKGNTTKACPQCGGQAIAKFSSLNMKYCGDCGCWFSWELTEGQKPLIGPSRDRGFGNELPSRKEDR